MIQETRIPVIKRCGVYLRWYYNGWMYWHWLGLQQEHLTEGEEYRTTGTRAIQINSGPVDYDQITGIRTILNATEIYILTENGWRQVRLDRTSLVVKKLLFGGYEATIRVIIGSFISIFRNSPVVEPPITPPEDLIDWLDCIGTQIWSAKNYASKFPGSLVYDGDEANRAIYGGLYSYSQVMTPGFCPTGAHVPTVEEWQQLIDYVGGVTVAGTLKESGTVHWTSPNTGATSEYSFDALPGGSYNAAYSGLGEVAAFMTSSNLNGNPYMILFFYNEGIAVVYNWDLSLGTPFASVRLVNNTACGAPYDGYGALYNWYAASKGNMFDDWFVPSQEELLPMLAELKNYGLGGFVSTNYACSTESTIFSSNVKFIQFTSGGISSGGVTKTMSLRVRLCRSFTSSLLYNKRDIGPAGGYIYIVIDNLNGTYTYYEAYFEDVVMMMTNITTASGATATAIGTGQSNCNLYLAQEGINDGAVLFADNLEYEYGSAIAPSGWHVPTQAEFETLITYLGGESVAGGHLKESGTAHWNIESTGADNSSGFTALGSGVRYAGSFALITEAIQMYHSDIVPDITLGDQIAKYILSDSDSVLISNVSGIGLNTGSSLRLIKDNSTDPGTVTDIDGNVYPTVKIGDQVWMASNLKVTKYNDGTPIPEVQGNAEWAALTTGARCWYNNTPE